MPRRPVDAPYTILETKKGQVFVDTEDLEKILSYNTWNISKRGCVVCYSETGSRSNRLRRVYKLHRVIMDAPDDMLVDHINRDPLDNRKVNLRICTQMYNGRNLSIKSNNTSGFSGVCWDKSRKLWTARLKINYKDMHLGRFAHIEEAISARLFAESYYYGEFAPNA